MRRGADAEPKVLLTNTRDLVRIVFRDTDHVAERLTLQAVQRLGEPSLAWAQAATAKRPGVDVASLTEEVRHQAARVARIDGAVSGTPFLIALVPVPAETGTEASAKSSAERCSHSRSRCRPASSCSLSTCATRPASTG